MDINKNISSILKGIKNPTIVTEKVKKRSIPIEKKMISLYFHRINDKKILHIMDQDWDNLIILDACRFDYFKQQNDISGELKKVLSGGGESWEYMKHNFVNNEFHDTIYVTANPHVDRIPDGTFFAVENVLDRWDSDLEVVHPEDIVSAAINTHEQYPNKRLIVHFMQPHEPWLGPTAEKIRSNFNVRGINRNHGKKELGHDVSDPRKGDRSWFSLVQNDDIDSHTMKIAYQETLDIGLNYTKELVQKIDGKSVITADHGEMLGEKVGTRSWYGHHSKLWTKKLRHVPYFEIPADERRDITQDEPVDRDRIDNDIIQDRLQALGYK